MLLARYLNSKGCIAKAELCLLAARNETEIKSSWMLVSMLGNTVRPKVGKKFSY